MFFNKKLPSTINHQPSTLLVGLGNPGKSYASNRHNIGFMAVDAIAEHYGFSKWAKKFQGLITEGTIDGEKVFLLKPQTYMNLSGESVAATARFYKIAVDNMVVIHDELDIDFGFAKLKKSGGNAGHNGLESIESHIGKDFFRFRFGIGKITGDNSQHVLSDFSKKELADLPIMLDKVTVVIIPMVKEMKKIGAKNSKINLRDTITSISSAVSAVNMDPGLRRDDKE